MDGKGSSFRRKSQMRFWRTGIQESSHLKIPSILYIYAKKPLKRNATGRHQREAAGKTVTDIHGNTFFLVVSHRKGSLQRSPLLRSETPAGGGAVGLGALHAVGFGDGDYSRLTRHPVERDLGGGFARLRRRVGQGVLSPVHAQRPPQPPATVPNQRALVERRIGDYGDVVLKAVGDDVPLGATATQVVQDLI